MIIRRSHLPIVSQLWWRQSSHYRFWMWMIVCLCLTQVATLVPVIGSFGYAFAVFAAIPCGLAAVHRGAALGAWLRRTRLGVTPGPCSVLFSVALVHLPFVVMPLLVITWGAFFGHVCDGAAAIRSMLWVAVASTLLFAWLGASVGFWLGTRPRLRRVAPALVYLLLVMWAIIEVYTRPAVFSYNLAVGYFPGQLYDAVPELPRPLYWARAMQLALVIGCFLLVFRSLLARKRWTLPIAVVSLLAGGHVLFHRADFGLSYSAAEIEAALGGVHETDHFRFVYPASAGFADDIPLIAQDAEFRLAQLVKRLDVEPPEKITAFYFRDPEQKSRYMGARNVYMAKPWRSEIYVHHQPFPHSVMRHEIAHVVAAAFGDDLFGVSAQSVAGLPLLFNVALIEGTAVAADWPGNFDSDFTPHETTVASMRIGRRLSLAQISGSGFFAASSHASYMTAGSFVKFVIDRYGIDAAKRLYREGGNIESALGKSQASIEAEWVAYLESMSVPDTAAEILAERLKRPGVLSQRCGNAIAARFDELAEHARRREWPQALEVANELCAYDRNRADFLRTKADILVRQERFQQARDVLLPMTEESKWDAPTISSAYEMLAKIAWRQGDADHARTLIGKAMSRPLSRGQQRKLLVLAHGLAARTDAVLHLFWSARRDVGMGEWLAAGALTDTQDLVIRYLLARNSLSRPTAHVVAIEMEALSRATLPQVIVDETMVVGARAAFLACDAGRLHSFAQRLTRAEAPMLRALGRDWRERITWSNSHYPVHCGDRWRLTTEALAKDNQAAIDSAAGE